MSSILHRIYPWKLFKDIEDLIFGRLTGPEYPSSSSRLFTSDVPQRAAATRDPIRQSPSAPPNTLLLAMGESAPLGSDSLTPATKPLPDLLQAEDVQIPQPRSAPNAWPGVTAGQSTTVPEPPPDLASVPAVPVYPPPITSPVPLAIDEHPAPELGPPQNPPAASISTFKGSKDFTFNNSLINTVGGNFNQSIFKFDGNTPLTEELRSLFVSHIAGTGPALEFVNQVKKYMLAQSIRDLPRANAAYNDYAEDNRRVSCFEGTRQALLSDMGEWIIAATNHLIYVLSGLAGIGKSTVAQTIAERAANLGILGASFFFSRNEADHRNAGKFVTTIAFQLCAYNEEFSEAIGKALTEDQGAAVTTKGPEKQLAVLILEPLRDLSKSRSRPVVIVVDALDECDEKDVPSILTVLRLLVQGLPSFKVILTTRPQPHIRVSPEVQKVFYLQDIDKKIVEGDICLYLKHCLSWEEVAIHLPTLIKPWKASDEEIEGLVRGASTLFIIASMSVLFIRDTKARNPAAQMRKLRSAFDQNRTPLNSLNNFYGVILRSALPVESDPDMVERFQAVIGTIILAQDPMPIEPLAKLIGLESEDVCAVLDNFQPVISLGGGRRTPQVYHQSFPDYITDPTRCKDSDLFIVRKGHHTRICGRCFQVMNTVLKNNILNLGTPERFMKNDDALAANGITEARLGEKIPLELRYACIWWANHFESADIDDGDLMKKLELFGNEHILHWFEALSWICRLDLAPRAVGVLLTLLKSTSAAMHDIFYDALRFISRYYAIIHRSALHTYYSALPFTPTKNLLYKKYHKDRIQNLCELDGVPERSDASIVKFNSPDRITRLAFSADSSKLASWTQKELWLWDAKSGTPVKTFNGDRIKIAEDFSVVAFSEDSTVTLHCVATDAPVTTLPHAAEVVRTALSFDGARIAAGLSDGTVSVWDRSRGEVMCSLGGYGRGQLEFSPSHYRLAYGSTEGGIMLSDGATGGIIGKLDCGSERRVEFTFSRDGSRLASLSEMVGEGKTDYKGKDHSLRLWNTENGELIGVAKSVREELAISDDGSLIATSGWITGAVQLRGGNSLSLIDTLEIRDPIYSLAFSLDLLAIGCYTALKLYDVKSHAFVASISTADTRSLSFSPDCTRLAGVWLYLQLWDVPSIKAIPYKNQSATVTALAFSPDCSRLASGASDGVITLWETCSPCQPIATQKQHSSCISTLAFSPDGGRLASGSWDYSIRFWNGRDGEPIGTLEHSFRRRLEVVAFSSSQLAAATDEAITLFNRETLCLVHTIDQGTYSLSFSPDGSLLASAYNHSSFSGPTSDVTVLAVRDHTVIATFHLDLLTDRVTLSLDGSRLAVHHLYGGFKFFDIDKKCPIQLPGREDLNWLPHLNGTLISRGSNCLLGQFIDHSDPFPLLWIPDDVNVSRFAVGSCMFALGTSDGQVLIGRAPTSSIH